MALPQLHIGPETPYLDVLAQQERAVAEVVAGTGRERVFFVEHAPVYTAGSSADGADWLGATLPDLKDIPVISTGRGGKMTYHGPGQRVIYPILNLNLRGRDVRHRRPGRMLLCVDRRLPDPSRIAVHGCGRRPGPGGQRVRVVQLQSPGSLLHA